MHKSYTNRLTVLGRVVDFDAGQGRFKLHCRSGDIYDIFVGAQTTVQVLQNLDEVNRDRVPTPEGFDSTNPTQVVKKYVRLERLMMVDGIWQENGDNARLDARELHVLQDVDGRFIFEESGWWLTQISRMADTWIADLFGPGDTYDFSRYRTNLDITGAKTSDVDQECATLSRLIYGLSSAYLMTGNDRYVEAARAGIEFQRENFRMTSPDGRYTFWAFGLHGKRQIVPSQNGDDFGALPLYEQIYALAGMAQFYRITLDPTVLTDIRRTVASFDEFYLDKSGLDGYFSHLDPVTHTADTDYLGDNKLKKNWNSVGDHIPAYLVNVILALEPLPAGRETDDVRAFLGECKAMLRRSASLIVEKFPDPNPEIPYVCERYYQDWTQDTTWRWQQNRAVCGHNLKIAWNLTRLSHYYADEDPQFAAQLMEESTRLGTAMSRLAVDQVRSGIYDVVEREPKNGMPQQFTWWNTKDFWQQEQGILAYLSLYGRTGNSEHLELAREITSFYNISFLNHDDCGVYFRVTEDGLPFLEGGYRNKGNHSKSGYHTFELCYLAHLYTRAFVTGEPIRLYFKPDARSDRRSINVLPDFIESKRVRMTEIEVDGVQRSKVNPQSFQIDIDARELGRQVAVTLTPAKRAH